MQKIFSDNLLSHYLPTYSLHTISGVRDKMLRIKALLSELKTGKIASLKEEEIKSRFVTQFFGDVLGFSYGDPEYWMLREEKKSTVDGTKPDAILGYCFIDKRGDDVRAVIEVKDANTNLDEKQRRSNDQSPVDQAFSYVAKMGGNCEWVIVSNINEIRFYHSLDRSQCQSYFLNDLIDENRFKELLFLFHKDKLIKRVGVSSTQMLFNRRKSILPENDKPIHIIDSMYNSLKRFEGFGYVDPHFISSIAPFNILTDHVWHYDNGNLFTINNELFFLLKEITIDSNQVVLSDKLKAEVISFNIIEAREKLEWTFNFLNNCYVHGITAIENYRIIAERNKRTIGFSVRTKFNFEEGNDGITKDIVVQRNSTCDCLSCIYRSLDLKLFLRKLKAGNNNEDYNTLEYAYGNYLAASDNFKTSYKIYKKIENEIKGRQGKAIEYFLVKFNIQRLYNLISDYQYQDKDKIIEDIKAVDLDKVVYEEIEFDIDNDVKKYVLKVKEDDLVYKAQEEIEELISAIEKYYVRYKNGLNGEHWGPDLSHQLSVQYFMLYLFINRNFILFDIFKRYKRLTERTFLGLVKSHQTPKIGLKHFDSFFLVEAILNIPSSELQSILADVDSLKTLPSCIEDLLSRLNNYTNSFFENSLFNTPHENSLFTEQLVNYRFQDRVTSIFSNLFTVLSKLDIHEDQYRDSVVPLISFLKIEDTLAWHDLEQFGLFVKKKGKLFKESELVDILTLSIEGDEYHNHKYKKLIEIISQSLVKFYPDFRITNKHLINTAIHKSVSKTGEKPILNHLVHLLNVCGNECKTILQNAFKNSLNDRFSSSLYEELVWHTDFNYDDENYFSLYADYVNLNRGMRTFKHGKGEFSDIIFMNFIYMAYRFNVAFDRREMKMIISHNFFESWLLNPFEFDYQNFNAKWLTDINNPTILNRMRQFSSITIAIGNELENEFNPILVEIQHKYFGPISKK